MATRALQENVRKMGKWLMSGVAIIERVEVPFEQQPDNPYEFRYPGPVPFKGRLVTVYGDRDWPEGVEDCSAYPEDFDVTPLGPYRPELNQYLEDFVL